MKNFVVGQVVANLACIGKDYVNTQGVVEGVGSDWLVVRSLDGEPHFVTGGQLVCLSKVKADIVGNEKPREVAELDSFNSDDDHKDFRKFLCQNGLF